MAAGWAGFWGNSPATAPIIHFGGQLQPRLLRIKEFVIGAPKRRLSIAFVNPGRGGAAGYSRLSIDAVPRTAVPRVEIDWPVAKGAGPLRTSNLLLERCCYWEFYNPAVQPPSAAVPGTAAVKVILPPSALPLELSTNRLEVPVRTHDPAKGDTAE